MKQQTEDIRQKLQQRQLQNKMSSRCKHLQRFQTNTYFPMCSWSMTMKCIFILYALHKYRNTAEKNLTQYIKYMNSQTEKYVFVISSWMAKNK